LLQLELLLLLRERGGEWSISAIADELRVTVHSAESYLVGLLASGLVRRDAGAVRYAYAPDDEQRRWLVDELSDYYSSMQSSVIAFIYPGDRDTDGRD
jgi:predicted transcriptional regulator